MTVFTVDGVFLRQWTLQNGSPLHMAIDTTGGIVCVTELIPYGLAFFQPNGVFFRRLKLPFSSSGITIYSGHVYATDFDHNRVMVYEMNGTDTPVRIIGEGQLECPYDITRWCVGLNNFKFLSNIKNSFFYFSCSLRKFDFIFRDRKMDGKSEFSNQLTSHLLAQTPLCTDVFRIIKDYSWAAPGTFLFKWTVGEQSDFNKERGIIKSNGICFHPIRRLIFIMNQRLHCIQVFKPDGSFVNKWEIEGCYDGQSIAVHPNYDLVFVVDSRNYRVLVFHIDGSFVRKFSCQEENTEQLFYPSDIAVDALANLVYITDMLHDKVAVFTLDGLFIRQWPNLCRPDNIAVDATDNAVLVTDSMSRSMASRVSFFQSNGVFIRQLELCFGIYGMMIHSKKIYVISYDHQCVMVYEMDGTLVRYIGQGQLQYPCGITIDPLSNILYVAEEEEYYIHAFAI